MGVNFFQRYWIVLMCLPMALLAASTILSMPFTSTKIQTYVGWPLAFHAYGVFPWLGDLEERSFFYLGNLLIDMAIWCIIAVLGVFYYSKYKRR